MTHTNDQSLLSRRDVLACGLVRSIVAPCHINRPYRHSIVEDFLPPRAARALVQWLMTPAIVWQRSTTVFYQQQDVAVADLEIPPQLRAWFTPRGVGLVRAWVEATMGRRMLPRVGIGAMKWGPGDGIGLHTDIAPDGLETHRVVLRLCSKARPGDGAFVLFSSRRETDVASILHAKHNLAIAFEISDRSYHALSEVRGPAQYALIYSLRAC